MPRGNPHRTGEKDQTQNRKAPGLNPEPFWCEVTELTRAPPSTLIIIIIINTISIIIISIICTVSYLLAHLIVQNSSPHFLFLHSLEP